MAVKDDNQTLYETARPFRLRIAFTYSLTLLENVFEILYPFAIGLAINGLIAGDGWQSVLPLAGIWFAHICTGAARQLYDTRLFARIYSEVAGQMIVRQRASGSETSEVAARTVMAREAVDFFEFEIPELATAVISLIGAVLMLFLYDLVAGGVMAALLIPISFIYLRYGKRALSLSIKLNNRHEKEVGVVEDGRRVRVSKHFRAWSRWRILLSDLQARTWAGVELILLAAVIFTVFRVTGQPDVQVGDVFAAVSYTLAIVASLDAVPYLVEQASRMVDIRRRVDDMMD